LIFIGFLKKEAFYRMVEHDVFCLKENIISQVISWDISLRIFERQEIFGANVPPFLGGGRDGFGIPPP
jgi:hypothetical protein